MANIEQARKAFAARILDGDGKAPREQRKAAFAGSGAPASIQPLLDKVTTKAASIGDDDVHAAKQAHSEDQVFELVVCAAVGQATRQYEGALAALAAAAEEK